jgi:hypothetical protein
MSPRPALGGALKCCLASTSLTPGRRLLSGLWPSRRPWRLGNSASCASSGECLPQVLPVPLDMGSAVEEPKTGVNAALPVDPSEACVAAASKGLGSIVGAGRYAAGLPPGARSVNLSACRLYVLPDLVSDYD